jgi:putative tryptophan/tyrosine transport system substrate-binding protein
VVFVPGIPVSVTLQGSGQMAIDIGRRQFISALSGAAVTWPLAAQAQQPAMPVIGVLNSTSRDDPNTADQLRAFHRGLAETGYIEGQNVVIEYRWAENQYDRLPVLAAELVRRRVAVIAATGIASALAAKAVTTTIPIVFNTGGDPVKLGLVSGLNRPGGNLTGVSSLGNALVGKQLQLLHELVPKADAIAFLANPDNPIAEADAKEVHAAAGVLGQQILVLNASAPSDIDSAFATLVRQRAGGLLVARDPFLNAASDQIATLALRHAVPTILSVREFAMAGGLVSYGPSFGEGFRQTGVYTGRILKGEKPADLPVVLATKFELVINLKTAKALGLTVSNQMQLLADEVIE